MLSLFRKFISWLRSSKKRWSAEKDRDYHDVLFSSQDFDPFSPSYPGNITIRRFADLISPFLKDLNIVLDLGCGTGEISCELAKRHPGLLFLGVDHSETGIERALFNAQSLDLKNITFNVADMESFRPDSSVDIILLCDAFHHLTDPRKFVQRFGSYSSRFLLVEPRGDWKGSWRKDIDYDWLILELEKIRARVAYGTGEKEPEVKEPKERQIANQDEPIENRYTLDDFKIFFSGYGLDIRGTVSGLDVYPPDSLQPSPSREAFGKIAYELYRDIDERLYKRDLDLLAKHWVIYAERGATGKERLLPRKLPDLNGIDLVKGPHDVEYLNYEGPRTAAAGDLIEGKVRVKNRSFRFWSSADTQRPDLLSYHWLNKRGAVVVQDGERSPLPRPLGPDEECDIVFKIKMPEKPGRFTLAVDLVQENTAWFSDAGSPSLHIPFRIKKKA
jgi:SAM-dependent methyltransferase